MRLPPQQKMCAAIYNFWETLTVFCSFAVLFSMKRPHKRSIDEAPYGLMSVYERNESRPHKNVSLCVPQSAVSRHNMSYWKGRQYIGVGPGDLLSRLQDRLIIVLVETCIFVPRQEHTGGSFFGAREVSFARPGPRLWSLTCGSVKYSRGDMGHGGGFNWAISNCELLHLEAVVLCLVMSIYIYIVITRGAVVSTNSEPVWNVAIIYQPSPQSVWLYTAWDACWRSLYMCLFFQTFCPCETL